MKNKKRHSNKHNKNKSTIFNRLVNLSVTTLTAKFDKSRPRIGDKCKLNVERITGRKEWGKLNPKYKQFVQDNKNTIFTVQQDKFKPHKDGFVSIVSLVEDTTEPKWLWCVDDLIKIED